MENKAIEELIDKNRKELEKYRWHEILEDVYKIIVDDLCHLKTLQSEKLDVCTACYGKGKYSVYEWDQVLEPDFCWDKPLLYKKWWIKEYLCPKCWGKSEQSQAEKVVEIKYVIRKCVCKTTLWLSDNYCPNCWAKIKWIA